MADKLYEESSIQAIATAIRAKNGSSDTYTVAEMSTAIQAIEIQHYYVGTTTPASSFGDDGDIFLKSLRGTITVNATSYDTTNYSYASIDSGYPISNAYNGSASTDHTRIYLKTGANSETYIYLKFDLSSLPLGSTISSVLIKANAKISTTTGSRVSTRQMQPATGTTLKGAPNTLYTGAGNTTIYNSESAIDTWTASELRDAGVRFYAKRGTSNTSTLYYMDIFGATITIEYVMPEGSTPDSLYYKENGSWNKAASADKKVSGQWVEQSDLREVFDPTKSYVKG